MAWNTVIFVARISYHIFFHANKDSLCSVPNLIKYLLFMEHKQFSMDCILDVEGLHCVTRSH